MLFSFDIDIEVVNSSAHHKNVKNLFTFFSQVFNIFVSLLTYFYYICTIQINQYMKTLYSIKIENEQQLKALQDNVTTKKMLADTTLQIGMNINVDLKLKTPAALELLEKTLQDNITE